MTNAALTSLMTPLGKIGVKSMYGMWEDRRTPEERRRDLEAGDKRRSERMLAMGFLKNSVRPQLETAGANVGLAGSGILGKSELLAEVDGVTYKITAEVDHDD